MFDLTFQMGWVGGGILVVGALLIGLATYVVGKPAGTYEWLLTAAGALVGGFVGSEYLGDISRWGPEVDGVGATAALIAGVVTAAVLALIARFLVGSMEGTGEHAA